MMMVMMMMISDDDFLVFIKQIIEVICVKIELL